MIIKYFNYILSCILWSVHILDGDIGIVYIGGPLINQVVQCTFSNFLS